MTGPYLSNINDYITVKPKTTTPNATRVPVPEGYVPKPTAPTGIQTAPDGSTGFGYFPSNPPIIGGGGTTDGGGAGRETPVPAPTTGGTAPTGGVGVPNFNYQGVDKGYYDALAQKMLDAQLASLQQYEQIANRQAYDDQLGARNDYFDQYRQAQYNRAGSGLGTSPLGAVPERQVQLGMSSTIGDILSNLAKNMAGIEGQRANAKGQKDLMAEQMYQQAEQSNFDKAMQMYQMEMQKAQMQNSFANSNSGYSPEDQAQIDKDSQALNIQKQYQPQLDNYIAQMQGLEPTSSAYKQLNTAYLAMLQEMNNKISSAYGYTAPAPDPDDSETNKTLSNVFSGFTGVTPNADISNAVNKTASYFDLAEDKRKKSVQNIKSLGQQWSGNYPYTN